MAVTVAEINSLGAMLVEQCQILEIINDDELWSEKTKNWWSQPNVQIWWKSYKADIEAKAEIERKKKETERQEKLALYNKLKEELGL